MLKVEKEGEKTEKWDIKGERGNRGSYPGQNQPKYDFSHKIHYKGIIVEHKMQIYFLIQI